MEISELFDALIRWRDLSRWTRDQPSYAFLMWTACAAPYLNARSLNIVHPSQYWRLQASLLRDRATQREVRAHIQKLVQTSEANEVAAARVCSELAARHQLDDSEREADDEWRLLPMQQYVEVEPSAAYLALTKRMSAATLQDHRLSRADIYTMAHLDREAGLDRRGLGVDQFAMLVSWVVREARAFFELDLAGLAERSASYAERPLCYQAQRSHGGSLTVRGYSLSGRLYPTTPRNLSREDGSVENREDGSVENREDGSVENREDGSVEVTRAGAWGRGTASVFARAGLFRGVVIPESTVFGLDAVHAFVAEAITARSG